MIGLDGATVLLQWAVGGLLFLWVTTRRRQVGIGYGWLLRGVYGAMALGAFAVGVWLDPVPVREASSLAVAAAAGVALAVSMIIFPLKRTRPELFDSIMPVVLTLLAVALVIRYFRNCSSGFLKEGVLLGALWLGINIALDLPLFSCGPMKMPIVNYFADIGLTYLILPAITVGAGFQAADKRESKCEA